MQLVDDLKGCRHTNGIPPAYAGLDATQLGIVAAKKCWVLHVDALIIGADGSVADATSLAVKVLPGACAPQGRLHRPQR